MRRLGAAAAIAAVLGLGSAADAADKLTLQLKWVTQAQFAGYYVAKDKGFYEEAGLDVTIKSGGPDINPSQVIAGGGAEPTIPIHHCHRHAMSGFDQCAAGCLDQEWGRIHRAER